MGAIDSHLFQALECLEIPFFLLDSQRRCVFASRAFHVLLGRQLSAECRLSISDFWPAMGGFKPGLSDLAAELVHSDGQTCRVRLGVTALSDGYQLFRVTASSFNAESAEGLHAQRLETLGMVASGIAHDFNNVLAGILGHVTYLKNILPVNGPHVDSLRSIEEGARKSSLLTQQILAFSRMEFDEKVARIELGGLIERTCRLMQGAISRVYNLSWKVPAKPVLVLGAEGRLAQVLANLIINSRDAVAPGGNIEVELSVTASRQTLERVYGGQDLSSLEYAVLSVRDNGHGIPPDVLQRIFEPYFSTKKEKGTGLGLSTVDAIARLYGGVVDVQSEVNVGTQISVYLPVTEGGSLSAQIGRAGEQPQELQRARGAERILVVDDEYPVRNVLSISLRHLGYEVEVAGSGGEACEKYSRQRFDLVILDVLMPELSGDQVFFRLREMDPEARVLLMSGFTSSEVVHNVLDHGGRGFMQKPFTIEELSLRVRDSLG